MENQIKVFGTAVGAVISYIVGGIGIAFAVLLGMMIIDFITGMMAGSVNEGLSSSTGKKGLIKKVYIILLISAVYLLQKLGLNLAGYTADGLSVAFAILEFVSILENGGKLGAPIPERLKNAIAALKGKGGESIGD
ncbi:MAG: phage holin family protein [Carboxydocellales bacterium]